MKKITYFLFVKTIGFYLNLLGIVFPKKAVQLAYSFFSEPREGKLSKDNLPEILKESETDTFWHQNQHFQIYTWRGNETVIFLIHGWESNASRWEKLIPYLQKSGSTIIALDGPAQGLSSGKEFSIPKYAEYIRVVAEKFKPQYLIGHSMGGKTCLYYQYLYQNSDIKKIITLGSPSDFEILLDNHIKLLSLNTRISKALKAKYESDLNSKLHHFSGQHFASKLNVKGLVAHDIGDKVVLFEEGKKIVRNWKEAQFIETSGLGHSLHDADLYKSIFKFLFEDSNVNQL